MGSGDDSSSPSVVSIVHKGECVDGQPGQDNGGGDATAAIPSQSGPVTTEVVTEAVDPVVPAVTDSGPTMTKVQDDGDATSASQSDPVTEAADPVSVTAVDSGAMMKRVS